MIRLVFPYNSFLISSLIASDCGPNTTCTAPLPSLITPEAPSCLRAASLTTFSSFTTSRRRVMQASMDSMFSDPPIWVNILDALLSPALVLLLIRSTAALLHFLAHALYGNTPLYFVVCLPQEFFSICTGYYRNKNKSYRPGLYEMENLSLEKYIFDLFQ
ncbi:hypothetical protein D3C76_38800 [compost metagenome]